MLVGTLQVELFLPGCLSLKEKRAIIKGMKTRIRNRFNVSAAEVDYQDKWQRCVLAVATVSNTKKHIEEVLNRAFQYIERESRVEVLDHLLEIF
ncbi:DUF503 domain-containing protein [bacterium]|nr:DUF503 domain-containing protein [bacterium]